MPVSKLIDSVGKFKVTFRYRIAYLAAIRLYEMDFSTFTLIEDNTNSVVFPRPDMIALINANDNQFI